MGYQAGKDALRNEMVLLTELREVASQHLKGTTPNSTENMIAKGWEGSFAELHKLNDGLVNDEVNFEETLTSERNLLVRLLAEASKPEGFSESWKALFEEDIAIIDRLLEG